MKRTIPVPEEIVETIARRKLRVKTLKIGGFPTTDYHVCHGWDLRYALNAAYRAGYEAARKAGQQ